MANIIKKFFHDFDDITKYYKFLVSKTKNHEYVEITNEWIIDNYYLLVEHKNDIINNLGKIKKEKKDFIENYYFIKSIVNKNNYNISFKYLIDELRKYQKENKKNFTYRELKNINFLLIFIYTERLNLLCKEEYNKVIDQEDVSNIIKNNQDFTLESFIPKNFDIQNNTHYIFEVNNQLYKTEYKSNELFKELNEYLKNNNVSIKELINEEYQKKIDNNILISNIFNDFKEFFDFSIEKIYEKVSKCEKLLLTDSVYKNLTIKSKNSYRSRIVKYAKKKHINEYDYLESIFSSDEHIGFKLFKQKNNTLRVSAYLIILLLLTGFISFFLSNYFIKPRFLSFIILLIPISQIVNQIIKEITNQFFPINYVQKLDYSKGIPKESRTMVVIPTIVSDKEKIKEMFDKLETFYIINKSSNLYFTLLGDAKASNEEIMDYDKEISEYGIEYAKKLNEKYGDELFYFIYRKRIWNPKENSYLGYERKRGAICQFNKVLLGEQIDEKKYFHVNTLKEKKLNIKYVITLDTDTNLVLNSALNLVGAMAHPLNRPILNKNKTRVIRGYGIMQPKISVDIEATNKSLYSQIFAGIGGFDTYSSLVPDFYQDLFGEGSFCGKGIYDLKVFNELTGDKFPENLILSHDLLEGNYLRCGYISDIEIIEDFPSKFLVDTRRQHRWARGDTQIIQWISNKVPDKNNNKIKNPLNLLGKYKILDNIIRIFLNPMLLLILLLAFTLPFKKSLFWILFVLLEIAISILFFLKSQMARREKGKKVYYKNLYFGGKSILLRSYIVFTTIPYYTKMYMDAFFRTLYRLFISHKNLLNWITADEVAKTLDGSLWTYIKNFSFNIIISIILIIIGFISNNYLSYILAIVFISSPFLEYFVSKDIDHNLIELKGNKLGELYDLAEKTWGYFRDNLTEERHYLIPDNYQENREEKLDSRTSPTAIGYSLTSVISAFELELISIDEAKMILSKILKTIDSLDKWHGHLYNWYDIKSKKVIRPNFISTIDSGNLVSCLIITREFLKKYMEEDLVALCDKLIKNTNFKKLYTKKNVFSIGYDEDEGRLSIYNYNKFASESRLTSYLSICLGQVSSKHWFALDKSLTVHKGKKGLISWSGTAFEYFMPLLFLKNYPNTLMDETYQFAYLCQRDYVRKVSRKLPWGISESAYDELDNALNYKYKAFGIPFLKAKEDKENRIVISPYSSIMCIGLYPEEVSDNIHKLKKLGMYSDYGLYEAYDYDSEGIVRSYFAHHQGMILLGLTNYIKKDVMKNYFHANVNIKTFELLLKEKVQVKTNIDIKMEKYKKYDYAKEGIENDIRFFDYISYMPEMSVLSNKKYSLIMNDRGDSFSRYRTLQLNRYRKVTEQDYGMFLFAKDTKTEYFWSNTYAPTNFKPDKYEVVFAADKIKYLRRDGKISTKTEIVVCKAFHGEIRKITFKNEDEEDKTLEITSYTEPILSDNMDDVSHKVFNNMFISTEYDSVTNSLIAKRKTRGDSNINSYMITKLLIEYPLEKFTYETERENFIGRNSELNNPKGLKVDLSNYTGDNLDPILSIRNKILVPANSSTTIYYLVGFGRSREQVVDFVNNYNKKKTLEKEFDLSTLMNVIETKNMNISGENMRTYNIMLNYLYQTTKLSVSEERMDILRKNALGQTGLWKFGVSGDRPIILVEISDISDMSFIYEILKVYEYYKNKSIFVDVIIINSENEEYSKNIKKEIDDVMYRMHTLNSFYHIPGSVTVINREDITDEDSRLLDLVPRLHFKTSEFKTLKEAVEDIQRNNKISDYPVRQKEENIPFNNSENLTFNNGYGGFKNNGREYVIYNKETPTPWSNIIANKNFGTIVTNNGCGFTYAYNSGEFKISSWSNEMLLNDRSEGFKFNGKIFNPEKCTHGYGYSVLESETEDFYHEITEFVSLEDNVKIYLMKVKNKSIEKNPINIEFWINPTFGNFEEKTSRHILTEFMGKDNYLKMRNVYSINFSDVNVFMSSSERIKSAECNKMLVKNINIELSLEKDKEEQIVFVLGCSKSDKENLELIRKYTNIANCKKELKNIKDYWQNRLGTIQVSTPDKSFDYMINGWYLYQAISSRLFAKAGFYQVSGAFGYRDQLQDSMNIVSVWPEYTKNQILINAAHQFEQGDVLHWWHEKNHFGLRSRYKDDYLWLVYATTTYIESTNDISILYEQVPYVLGEELSDYENEKGLVFSYSEEKSSLLEHCIKSLELSMSSLGSHKLPLMGGGDWNDGMNRVGIKGKGESVWLGFFLYYIIDLFTNMMNKIDKNFDTQKYEVFNQKLKDSLNKKAWDGTYYLRAYFDNGDTLGSHENSECKIDLISQSFSIISGVAPKDRIEKVITSVEEQLVDDKTKIIKLLTPAFANSLNNPGYIMNYPRGIRENGGQYTHSVSWYLMALIKAGYYDRAYRYYQMINPINRTKKESDVEKYRVEPYVIAADIYSADAFKGRGGWTWYTGSAGWFYRVGIVDILGLKKQGNSLKINPKIPIAWDGFKAKYYYGETEYTIHVEKQDKKYTKLDDKELISSTIHLVDDKKKHDVFVAINK